MYFYNWNLSICNVIAVLLVIFDFRGSAYSTIARKMRPNNRYAIKMAFTTHYEELPVETLRNVGLVDITKEVSDIIVKSQVQEGVVTILSKHSTVSVTINEMEPRFVDDVRQFVLKLAPPDYPYLHNDVDFRYGPSDWPGGDKAWREFRLTQPPNAHAHLIAMLLGTSESIPINKGAMKIGTYQNIIIVDADGPKKRTIAIQVMGEK